MSMKTASAVLALLVSLGLLAGSAAAFSCPTLVKAANEAIAQAEPKAAKATDDRQKARNAGLIEEAKDLSKAAEDAHKAGSHARSEAKAKAAKMLADLVQ